MFPVAEHFVSINGEGPRAGELAVFIRFRGCNLCCSYCDTAWAIGGSAPAKMMSADELADIVRASGVTDVTLTGGEPLLQKDIGGLVQLLMSQGSRVEIETNGSISILPLSDAEYRPVFTMDYKLPSSGMEKHMELNNFSLLKSCDTVKFVSGSAEDLHRAAEIIKEYSLTEKCMVHISPVFGEIEPADIVEFMRSEKLNDVSLRLQLHKFIWAPDKRGV